MGLNLARVQYLVVHCTATPAHMNITGARIREWHMMPKPVGNGWSRPGYHDLILRDGSIETLNSFKMRGIHARGYNALSIAICLVGGSEDGDDAPGWQGEPTYNFEDVQIESLVLTLNYLTRKFPKAEVVGHRDLDNKKACPSFDAKTWWARGGNIRGARAYGVG